VAAARLQDGESNQAAIVVRVGDERVESRCVTFAEESISGHELLERSGLEVIANVTGAGVLVCSVEGQGCPAGDCLCQCQGEPCTYWSYWRWRDGEWQYAGLGAAVTEVRHGEIDGWSWGPGSVTSAIAPPVVSFDEVCAAPETASAAMPAQSAESGVAAERVSWLPYAAFLLVALLLGGAYLWVRRRQAP
jgi:hypothetical protein